MPSYQRGRTGQNLGRFRFALEFVITLRNMETLVLTSTAGMSSAVQRAARALGWKHLHYAVTEGPIFRHASPQECRRRWKTYRVEDLPMLPGPRFRPVSGKIVKLKMLLQEASQTEKIVLAPPPDLPGLFDMSQIIAALQKREIELEVWDTRSLHPNDLAKAIQSPRKDTGSWAEAERVRVYADWIVGLNASRAMTLYGRVSKAIPVGRALSAMLATFPVRPMELRPAELFDTASLQAWMLREHGWPATQTLKALQIAYERGAITYPFTTRRHRYGEASPFPGGIQLRIPADSTRDPLLDAIRHREEVVARGDMEPKTFGLCPQADWLESLTDLRPWIRDDRLRQQAAGVQLGSPRARMDQLRRLIEAGWVDPSRLTLLPPGKRVLEVLPASLTDMGTLSLWERKLEEVALGEGSAKAFQAWAERYVTEFLYWIQKEKIDAICE